MKTINEIKAFAKENYIPIIRESTLVPLLNLVSSESVLKILEIGTAIGYSGICMLRANKKAVLTTIEKNKDMADIAINNFTNTNVINRVNLILGDAKEQLIKLVEGKQKFDLIFLDGPKGQYINYLPSIEKLMKSSSILFTDDVFFGVNKSNKHNTIKRRLKQYIHAIEQPPFTSQIYNVDNGYAITKLL